jgi:hypothetical protein
MPGRDDTASVDMCSRVAIARNWWETRPIFWTVTRYVHLNPVRARLVEHPAAWRGSSFPGYAHRSRRLEWVAYDELLASWQGEFGGSDAAASYRQSVTAGLAEPPESPWRDAYHGWVLGRGAFIDRVRAMVRGQGRRKGRRESRRLMGLPLERVCEAVCSSYEIPRAALSHRGSRHPARAALAYVARQRTTATHAQLMILLGVSRPESVPNLTRRFATWLASDVRVREQFGQIEDKLDRLEGSEKTRNSTPRDGAEPKMSRIVNIGAAASSLVASTAPVVFAGMLTPKIGSEDRTADHRSREAGRGSWHGPGRGRLRGRRSV